MRLPKSESDYKPTFKQALKNKIRVLRDFYIVDDDNEEEYRNLLIDAVAKYPGRDYELILDKTATAIIMNRLG